MALTVSNLSEENGKTTNLSNLFSLYLLMHRVTQDLSPLALGFTILVRFSKLSKSKQERCKQTESREEVRVDNIPSVLGCRRLS